MRRLLVVTLCAALAAGACSGPEAEEVATVDGELITVGDVAGLYETDTLTIDAGFRLAAFRLVARQVVIGAFAEEFGAGIDQAATDAQYRAFLGELEQGGISVADATGIPGAAPAMLLIDAEITVLRQEVIDRLLADEDFIAGLAADPRSIAEVCAAHVLVDTEDAAAAALGRIEAGEDFAAVASEVSLDQQSTGGDLGCNSVGLFVEEFAGALMEAEVGVPFGPVETPFGWHVILVRERSVPSAADLAADPEAYLDSDVIQSVWLEWFDGRLAEAEVTVNPRFGIWDTVALRIIAPGS